MIRVLALGGFRVLRDGAEMKVLARQPLRGALLTYLAVEREVTRDSLITVFWPETRDATARHALRQALLNLRREIGAEWIDAEPLKLCVTDGLAADVDDFSAAVAASDWSTAARLYTGPFLAGVYLHRGHGWQAWVAARRVHYARAFRTACRNWVDGCLSAGDGPAAIAAARAWVAGDATEDEAQHRLIELLAGAGQRIEAVRQYEVYASMLRADGLEPLEETVALYRGLKSPPWTERPRGADAAHSVLAHGPDGQLSDAAGIDPEPETVFAAETGASPNDVRATYLPDVSVMRALAQARAERYGPSPEMDGGPGNVVAGVVGPSVAHNRTRRSAIALSGLLALVVLAGLLSLRGSRERGERGPLVAVLPFESLGGGEGDSLFAAGMQSEILTQLQRLGSIGVIGHTSTSLHFATRGNPVEIAGHLNADALLMATIVRMADRFRMNARLLDGASGRQLWAEAYEDSLTIDGLFEVQEKVALRIAGALEVALRPDELVRLSERPTPMPAIPAHDHYVAGELHFRQARWAQALAAFDSAVAADSTYARARASVAKAAAMLYFQSAGQHAGQRARDALERARQLAPHAPETHKAEGLVRLLVDGDYDGAIRSFDIALEGLPNDADLPYWAAVAYTLAMRLDSAATLNERAYLLDPMNHQVLWQRGGILVSQWRFREASRFFDQAAELAREHRIIFHQRWAVYMWGLGDTATARAMIERPPASVPHATILDKRAWHAYVSRDVSALTEIVDSLAEFPRPRVIWSIRLHQLLGNDAARRVYADSLEALVYADLVHADSIGVPPEELESIRAWSAVAHALSGDREKALETIQLAVRRAEQQHDKLNIQGTYEAEALTYAYLGMPEVAIQRLDSVFAEQRPSLAITPVKLRTSPEFDALRRHPLFLQLLEKYEPPVMH